jgi:hypothetical protein
MRKWWWWWLPGLHKKWRLEKRRIEALSDITGERLDVERMAQRPRTAGDPLDGTFLEDVLSRLRGIEDSAQRATHIDELEYLTDDAELQGLFSAYICPTTEISDEGNLAIDLIGWWGVPETAVKRLHDLFDRKLQTADAHREAGRGALYALFAERDAWGDYIDDYEETTQRHTRWLFAASVVLPLVAVMAFHFASWFSPLLFFGLLSAGAAGSCASVMAKIPALDWGERRQRDVGPSGELDASGRRILSRIGIGVVASLIGCAFLGWGLISIQNQTFMDAVNTCATSGATSCTPLKTLILLCVPMLLGFSERTLTSIEQRFVAHQNKSQKP